MPEDPTEDLRRALIESGQTHVDAAHADRTYNTQEFIADFEAISFLAPFVICRRRSDGVRGSMEFTHSPRKYFNFRPE